MSDKRKTKVLLVDDEAHIRLYMRSVIASMNGEVVAEAANGKDALVSFDQCKPDLILLDINMPVLDGISTLKEIRQRSADVVVVMLTSLADASVVEQCLDAGANYHLRKDVPLEQLKREIRDTWLEHRG